MREYWNKSEQLDKKLVLAYASYFTAKAPTLIIFQVPPGWMGLLGSPKGLKRVILPYPSREAVLKEVEGHYDIPVSEDTSCLGDLPLRFRDYFLGKNMEFPNQLNLRGATDFQVRVWKAVREIPYGVTKTYHWVAKKVGCIRGEQAIGQALSKNPLPIVIPCHRIIASSGKIGGFSRGVEMKNYLLNLEGISL
jgi:methylated-DNA-[protein]-cysteine S-methyltransferase